MAEKIGEGQGQTCADFRWDDPKQLLTLEN